MLDLVKRSLRVSSTTFDDELISLINAAMLEMKRCGIFYDPENEMIRQATVQFCKARFGYDNPEATRFERNFFEMLKAMSLSGDYVEPI